ncbi:MAG: glycoside hydrolase family 97 protein [Chlorobi bacterium]|nr:glycoside hydrolase family 97 protein [Chlorobiota bacterium]
MRILLWGIILILFRLNVFAKEYEVKSPDDHLILKVNIGTDVSYSVLLNNKLVIAPSAISLTIDNGLIFGKEVSVIKTEKRSVSDVLHPVLPRKYKNIKDEFNELKIYFRGKYSLILRAYDDGIAYRWVSKKEGDYKIIEEKATFNFTKDNYIWFPEEEKLFTHQERSYKYIKLSDITPNRFCSTGTLVNLDNNVKVYISEADLISYPGMFLKGSSENKFGLEGKFAGYPLETKLKDDRNEPVTKHAGFMAKVSGPREFPWRLIIVTTDDKQLIESELVYKLASPSKLKDISWIKGGKVAWDWWNALNIYGVNFKSGVNNDTYKYFIDFASKYGLGYIILDEGWYTLGDVTKQVESIDVPELVAYGKEKGVGIVLWVSWKSLDQKLDEALDLYSQWGVKGIKVDFMARDDQWMVNYYHRVAKKAAQRHLLVNFHGAYKPTGLRRTYPNVITREGVKGLEHNKWADDETPEHNVTIPFIRMVAGPMDFTPGAMTNANKRNFRIVFYEPMSQGTRCHQLAMYVVYESPLQMLADSPSKYYNNPGSMEFLSKVPTIWDDTKVLQAKVSDYIAIARKSGDKWFIGAMTDWASRTLKLKFDFLPEGEYEIKIWKDGVNADKHGSDTKIENRNIKSGDILEANLAPGGGWVAIVSKK